MAALEHNFKVGDVICAYHTGFHRIVEITERTSKGEPYNALIKYRKFLTPSGKRINTKTIKSCDVAYCTAVNEEWVQRKRAEAVAKWDSIQELIDGK
jgi:hypothetical protein